MGCLRMCNLEKEVIRQRPFVLGHINKKTAGRRERMLHLDKIYASVELRRTMRQKGTHINMETRSRDYIRKRGPKFRFDAEKYKHAFLWRDSIMHGSVKLFWCGGGVFQKNRTTGGGGSDYLQKNVQRICLKKKFRTYHYLSYCDKVNLKQVL